MRWAALILLAANLAIAGYLMFIDRPSAAEPDPARYELNGDKVKVLKPPPPPGKTSGAAPVTAGACLAWGSFSAAEVDRAREALAKLKPGNSTTREVAESLAYWVHVPPLRSRDEADRRLRDIEEAGIKDARVVTDGDRWRNAISLGIFRSEEAASAYLARMKEAKVRNVALAQRVDLLRLAEIVVADPTPAIVARLTELKSDFPGSELRAVACS